jgi:hypothetical protein
MNLIAYSDASRRDLPSWNAQGRTLASRNVRHEQPIIPMLEIAIALIVGFALGYGVREWVFRRRRQAERHRRAHGGEYPY